MVLQRVRPMVRTGGDRPEARKAQPMYDRPAPRLLACVRVVCRRSPVALAASLVVAACIAVGPASATAGSGLPQQDERPLDDLRSRLAQAKTIDEALLLALDLVRHPNHERAHAAVIDLLGGRGLAAHAVLNAMRHDRTAWPDVVDPLMRILGNGSETLIEPAKNLVQVWMAEEKSTGQAHKCLETIREFVRTAATRAAITGDEELRLRGAIAVLKLQERVADIRPLIDLLKLPTKRDTRARTINALEALTGYRGGGWRWETWKQWYEDLLRKDPDLTLLEIRQRAIDQAREAADAFALEELMTIGGLSSPELARFERYLRLPSEAVATAAAARIADLYAGVTGEAERQRIQDEALPRLIELTGSHYDRAVKAAALAIGKLARPTVRDAKRVREARTALLALVAEGTPQIQEAAIVGLENFAPTGDMPRDEDTPLALRRILKELPASSSLRTGLVRTIGAYGGDEAAKLFLELVADSGETDPVRVAAARGALANGHAKEAITIVADLLRTADAATLALRRQLIVVLGNIVIQHPAATEVLTDRLEHDQDLVIRISAADALGYVQRDSYRKQAAEALRAALTTSGDAADEKLLAKLAESLGRQGHAEAIDDLLALFEHHPDGIVHDAAAGALVEIGVARPAMATGEFERLLAAGHYAVAAVLFHALTTRDNGSALKDLTHDQQQAIALHGIDALVGTDIEANLNAALEVVNRRRAGEDPAFAFAEARVLFRLGLTNKDDRAKRVLGLVNVVRRDPRAVPLAELTVIEGWAKLALGKVGEARTAFRSLADVQWKAASTDGSGAAGTNGNGANGGANPTAPATPVPAPDTSAPATPRDYEVYWEYCVGYAASLTTGGGAAAPKDPEQKIVEGLLARLKPHRPAIAARGSRVLKAGLAFVDEQRAKAEAKDADGEKAKAGKPADDGSATPAKKPTPRSRPKTSNG